MERIGTATVGIGIPGRDSVGRVSTGSERLSNSESDGKAMVGRVIVGIAMVGMAVVGRVGRAMVGRLMSGRLPPTGRTEDIVDGSGRLNDKLGIKFGQPIVSAGFNPPGRFTDTATVSPPPPMGRPGETAAIAPRGRQGQWLAGWCYLCHRDGYCCRMAPMGPSYDGRDTGRRDWSYTQGQVSGHDGGHGTHDGS
jgi:hypothetical protein